MLQPYKNSKNGLSFKIMVSYYLRETLTTEASNHFSFKKFLLIAKNFGKPPMIVVILKIES